MNEDLKTILDRIETLQGDEPWPGYDDQTVAEINKALNDASSETLQTVREYERAHKNRSSVLKNTEKDLQNA